MSTDRGEDYPSRLNPDLPRAFSIGGREADFFIYVVCTDRNQHRRVLLTTARRELDGSHGMNFAFRWFSPPVNETREEFSTISHESYEFRCPRCPRNPRLGAQQWWSLVDDFGRRGLHELDISLLPF